MNIYSILGSQNMMICGEPVFPTEQVIRSGDTIVTCLEGQQLADIVKANKYSNVSLFCDPALGIKLEDTVKCLDFLDRNQLTVIVPSEELVPYYYGVVPPGSIHGEANRAYFRLYMAQILKKVGVSRADEYADKMATAVMNP
ncbi:MAG: hypothetical protein WEC81_02010 [Patescibacteria group bacterium]